MRRFSSHLSSQSAGLALFVLVGLLGPGCSFGGDRVHIGAKGFAEQKILAHAIADVVESEGGRSARVVDCGDTFGCHQALRSGRIDVLVEYTGTAALYAGRPLIGRGPAKAPAAAPDGGPAEAPPPAAPPPVGVTLDELRQAYAADDLTWMAPLGFDNSYRVVVAAARAQARDLERIVDLEELEDGVRMAAPPSYLNRPGDGLGALLSRHGLVLQGEPLLLDEPAARIAALEQGRVDAAILYGTDAALDDVRLLPLQDSLGFFPSYDAALLVDKDLVDNDPMLQKALTRLEGKISTPLMRQLNADVELEGWSPADAAAKLVAEVIPGRPAAPTTSAGLQIAVPERARLDDAETRALRAVRTAFPDRSVEVLPTDDPVKAVARGRTRLGVVEGGQLFRLTRRGLRREHRVEAVAVVGVRLLHHLAREAAGPTGLEAVAGARSVARVLGVPDARLADRRTLLAQLEAGDLARVILFAPLGDAELAAALERMRPSGVRLLPVQPKDTLNDAPWLRAARLPAETYPEQERALDTLATQAVLVGPARSRTVSGGGPVSAVPERPPPLSLPTVRALSRATGLLEAPDAVLPGPWSATEAAPESSPLRSVLDTVLNLLALVYMAWLIALVLRKEETLEE